MKTFASAFLILLLAICGANAQTAWDAGGDGTAWGDADNWTSGVPANPMAAAITFGNSAPDAAQIIDLGSNRTIESGGSILLSSTGNRNYTLTGGKLILNRTGANITFINNSAGTTTFTIDSDIDLHSTGGSGAPNYTISGTGNRTVNLNGNITVTSTPAGDRIVVNSENIRLNLRGNNSMPVFTLTNGEVVVYHANATGGGQLQGGSGANSILSLASNLTLNAAGTASTFFSGNMDIRIREDAPSSVDRVINFVTRIANSSTNGQITIVDNINSTGRVILNLAATTGATVQHVPINLGTNGLLRFSQTGATPYGEAGNGSGIISGGGDVELTGGGTTTFTAVNTYTGTTTLKNASTLLLSGDGSIGGTSNLHLESGTTFGISGITPTGYTFGTGQTISGIGTITTGNKNLTINGAISPGNSAGTLTMALGTGTLNLGSDVDLVFELGTVSDLVNLTSGTLNIGTGTLEFDNFSFSVIAGFGAGEYTLFQTTQTIAGTLGMNLSGQIGSFTGTLGFNDTNTNLILTVIPEPASSVLLLAGGGIWLAMRGRKGFRRVGSA